MIAQFNNTPWLAMPASMAAALKIPGNCTASSYNPASICPQPAAPGDFLVFYVTGLGKATPNGDPNGVPLKTGDLPRQTAASFARLSTRRRSQSAVCL